jgi:hypothetical protein
MVKFASERHPVIGAIIRPKFAPADCSFLTGGTTCREPHLRLAAEEKSGRPGVFNYFFREKVSGALLCDGGHTTKARHGGNFGLLSPSLPQRSNLADGA